MTAKPRGPIDADIPPGIVARRKIGGFLARHWARVLLVAAVLIFAFHFMPQVTYSLTDTETVLLPLVYQDVVVEHHPISEWQWPGASSLVPDDIVFFALRFLGHDDWFAMEGTTVFFFLGLVAGCIVLARASGRPYTLGLVTLLILIVVAQACDFTPGSPTEIATRKPLFQPVYHAGTAVLFLAGTALLLAQIRGAGRAGFWTLLVLTYLGVISDFLFLVDFAIPAFLAEAAMTVAFRREWRRHLSLAAGLGVTGVAGFFLAPYCFPATLTTDQYLTVGLDGVHVALPALWSQIMDPDRHYLVFLFALDIVAVLAGLAVLGAFCFFKAARKMPAPVLWAAIFCGSVIACDWGAVIFTGGYLRISEDRYVLIALLLPLFVLAFGLHAVIHWRPWLANGVAAAAAIFIGVCAFIPQSPSGEYLGDLQSIPVLKNLMNKNHITAGLITYWRANLYTFLSHGDVTLRCETDDGSIVRLHDTMTWYGRGQPIGKGPRFRLVFPEQDGLTQRYGKPDQVVHLPGGDTVWIYSEEHAITYNPYFDQLSNRWTDNGHTMPYKASEMDYALGQVEGTSRVAAPGAGDVCLTRGA